MQSRTLAVISLALLVACIALPAGCGGREADVVLYTSVDQPVAQPVVDRFTAETGVTVRVVTDAEASKSVGLAERLRAEAANPRADVWWGNEPFHTVRLAGEGLLAEYRSPSADDVPDRYKDEAGRWASVGLRARVLAVSTKGYDYTDDSPELERRSRANAAAARAVGLEDLRSSDLKFALVMARPTAGTTAGHVAALYVLWGDERADQFFQDLRANRIALVGGNGPAAQQVAAGGTFRLGLTDNDDVANVAGSGADAPTIRAVLLDQGEGGIGTLTLPTTVGLVAGRPDSPAAKKLVDYLLSAEVERTLLDAKFAIAPVRPSPGAPAIRAMDVDYAAVATKMPDAIRRATAILEGR